MPSLEIVPSVSAALAHLSDVEFLAALAMLLVGAATLTTLGLLHRPPGASRPRRPAAVRDRAA